MVFYIYEIEKPQNYRVYYRGAKRGDDKVFDTQWNAAVFGEKLYLASACRMEIVQISDMSTEKIVPMVC